MRIKFVFHSLFVIISLNVPFFCFADEGSTGSEGEFVKYTYSLEKGHQYGVCRDLLVYLNRGGYVLKYGGSNFGSLNDDFSTPEWNVISPDEGVKIQMQLNSYFPVSVDVWKKRVDYLQSFYNGIYTVESSAFDLNNDGYVDRIVRFSWLEKHGIHRLYVNHPINKVGNLSVDWFEGEIPLAPSGEVFYYQGRIFILSAVGGKLTVKEPMPSPMRDQGGIAVKPNVCIILENE
ncbi:hypothetical protein [Amphritea sp.]|uniref:hypothetical protein n=1 Tax=Amphritea sp. TaxID=1872502 RepID=UPI003D10CF70